ncbi:MAG: response regulator [Planctomycetaceae bacterium]|nr:MAG: response regulator [Planctomycetaceae bacterium]
MEDTRHTILCVDDEKNILNSMKRLLRREPYRLLTASNGEAGIKALEEAEVHLVISDQRMPDMSGTDFLSIVRKQYPDVMRVILTGYTEVDSITESINNGHVYKFWLKPWDDQSLKLEIKQVLEQYDLIRDNRLLHEKVLNQNEELKSMNDNLGNMVRERTEKLESQNQALEISHAIMEDLPIPIIGISADGTVVLTNRMVDSLPGFGGGISVGKGIEGYFSDDVEEKITSVLSSDTSDTIKGYQLSGTVYDIDLVPLSKRFRGQGVILTLKQVKNYP